MVPDLGGTTVMVLPVQVRSGVHADLDREIAFALTGGDRRESWAMPDDLREMLARNPGERIPIDNLPVSVFRAGEVERIGDPLFGYLYRLGILADAGLALIPVEAVSHGDGQGEARVHLSAALVDTRGGWVRWFGVVEGEMGSPGDLAPAATAADALARRVAR